jgi:hypothetical protein
MGYSYSDLLQGFRKCKEEIKTLRRQNELMAVPLNMADRILNAVNSHRPLPSGSGMSEDIIWQIEKTENFLEGEIERQVRENNLNKEASISRPEV